MRSVVERLNPAPRVGQTWALRSRYGEHVYGCYLVTRIDRCGITLAFRGVFGVKLDDAATVGLEHLLGLTHTFEGEQGRANGWELL